MFLTSKPDKLNHGFGLKNIDDVIKKYKGIKKISVDMDVFTIMIMIPIPWLPKTHYKIPFMQEVVTIMCVMVN